MIDQEVGRLPHDQCFPCQCLCPPLSSVLGTSSMSLYHRIFTKSYFKVPLQCDHSSARTALPGSCFRPLQSLAEFLAFDSGPLPCPAAVEALVCMPVGVGAEAGLPATPWRPLCDGPMTMVTTLTQNLG